MATSNFCGSPSQDNFPVVGRLVPPLTVGYGNDKTQTTGRTDRQQLAGQLEEQSVEQLANR